MSAKHLVNLLELDGFDLFSLSRAKLVGLSVDVSLLGNGGAERHLRARLGHKVGTLIHWNHTSAGASREKAGPQGQERNL